VFIRASLQQSFIFLISFPLACVSYCPPRSGNPLFVPLCEKPFCNHPPLSSLPGNKTATPSTFFQLPLDKLFPFTPPGPSSQIGYPYYPCSIPAPKAICSRTVQTPPPPPHQGLQAFSPPSSPKFSELSFPSVPCPRWSPTALSKILARSMVSPRRSTFFFSPVYDLLGSCLPPSSDFFISPRETPPLSSLLFLVLLFHGCLASSRRGL